MNKTHGLKIGVIGVGQMGNHHARILSQMSGVTLAGVYDPDQARALEIARKYNTKALTSIEELL